MSFRHDAAAVPMICCAGGRVRWMHFDRSRASDLRRQLFDKYLDRLSFSLLGGRHLVVHAILSEEQPNGSRFYFIDRLVAMRFLLQRFMPNVIWRRYIRALTE